MRYRKVQSCCMTNVSRKMSTSNENTERAYIAASRRTDRSIEARLQSARMASEIHRQRTGRPFLITEDIVASDGMYEEIDTHKRPPVLLAPEMQTASIECNSRVEAYLQHRRSMSSYVACLSEQEHWGAIERLFAESFPDATAQARRVARQLQLPSFADSEDDIRYYFDDAIDIQGGEPTSTPTHFGGDVEHDLPRSSGASVPVDERRHDLGHDQDFPFTSDYPLEMCMILQGDEAGFDAHSAFSEVDRGKYCNPADVFHADGNLGARDGNEPLTNSKEE